MAPPTAGVTAAELAEFLKGTLVGDGARRVSGCATLAEATPEQASLFHVAKYAKELETTRAGVVILAPGEGKAVKRAAGLEPLTVIECKNTYYAWQQTLVKLLGHRQHPQVGVSPLASIHPTAKIGAGANVHPFAVIGENVTVGDRSNVFSHVTLMHGVSVGEDTTLYPGVTVYERCRIGSRCLINAGTSIGNDGSAYAHNAGVHHKVPQNGIAIIEDDVEIMANSVVERAVLDATVVGRGTKIGSCCIIGHNCRIGAGNIIIGGVCIAGSTTTGNYVVIGGQAGLSGHLDIPDGVRIAAQSGVMSNPEPGTEILGSPALEAGHAKRCYALFVNLPELASRLRAVEKQLKKLDTPG
jgi:UDP-3-O-[3-hydroxymyristoyl] glucosamine N-acyltransferase